MNTFKTKGVCSSKIKFSIKDNIVSNVAFQGGCSGNLKGISSLVDGLTIDEVINRLSGIKCGFKNTSCPDQLAKALGSYK